MLLSLLLCQLGGNLGRRGVQPDRLDRLAQSANVLGHHLNVAVGVDDALVLNHRSPDDPEVADRLDQDVTDRRISPHENADLLLKGVTCHVQLVDLLLRNVLLLYSLYHFEGDLVGPVAGRSILIRVIRRQVLHLTLPKSLLYLLNHLLHVSLVRKVFPQVADLDVGTLDEVHFVCVGYLLGRLLKLEVLGRDDMWYWHRGDLDLLQLGDANLL